MLSDPPDNLPVTAELLSRITANLHRAQGFMEILLAEIDDPNMHGPGIDRSEWKRLALDLQQQLVTLDAFLSTSKDLYQNG